MYKAKIKSNHKVIKFMPPLCVLAVFILLSSCDTRTDYFERINSAPEFFIYKGGEKVILLNDSLRLSQGEYSVKYYFKDEQKFSDKIFSYEIEVGQGNMSVNFTDSVITYEPESEGKHVVKMFCTDMYDKVSSAIIELVVYDNLPPVANLTATLQQDNNYKFDASASYDPDGSFGGKIVKYKFIYGGKEPLLDTPVIFINKTEVEGIPSVGVKVLDNNSEWSEAFVIYTSDL